MLIHFEDSKYSHEQLADMISKGKAVPLTYDDMKHQTFLAPYIAVSPSMIGEVVIGIKCCFLSEWRIPRVNRNIRQFREYISLSKEDMVKICKIFIEKRKTK